MKEETRARFLALVEQIRNEQGIQAGAGLHGAAAALQRRQSACAAPRHHAGHIDALVREILKD